MLPVYLLFLSYAFSLENWQSTSTKQHDACKSTQQSAEKETAEPCAHPLEKEQKEIQLSGSLPHTEGPEFRCATSLPIAEASNDKLQCANDAFNPIPSPSYACDLRHDDGTNNQAEDSNNSAPARISYHQAPDDTARHSQCKDRFSPLLTFRRRVKRKINLDEPAEEDYSKDNGKRCSTPTCSPPSFLVSDAPLLKETGGNSLDTAYKVCCLPYPISLALLNISSHIHGSIIVFLVHCYLLKR
jgi:hypothetical protein